jgi:hypothetical protein
MLTTSRSSWISEANISSWEYPVDVNTAPSKVSVTLTMLLLALVNCCEML